MRLYLAAPYVAREQVAQYAGELTRMGFTVTSSWLQETHEISAGTAGAATDLADEQVSAHAVADMRDIDKSDQLVLFTASVLTLDKGFGNSGGRHVETGYALAQRKPVLVVGEPENVFHRLGAKRGVLAVPSWHEAVVELAYRLVSASRDMPRAAES